ncbi:MAG: hypothetical protein KGL39_57940 [Patescibacteria group bacterium]|nr:hypothetical protein [Patescibacteria group bacterium]
MPTPIEFEDENEPEPVNAGDVETVDAGSPEGVTKQRRAARKTVEKKSTFWKRMLADADGRAEIWALIAGDLHAFNTDFSVSPVGFPDPNAAWYRRGEQDAGLRLYHKLLELDPDGIKLMHDEHDARFKPVSRKRA